MMAPPKHGTFAALMAAPVLTRRQLGRATLARQMLLGREETPPLAAVERLGGLQAQLARPPHVGLWSRLHGFRRDALTGAVQRREVVRATMMRGTLHLVSARDLAAIRPALQPMLSRGVQSVLRERAAALDVPGLVSAARAYLAGGPRTFEEIRDHLGALGLPGDERARGFAVRMHVPLVQVPDSSAWGYPSNPAFALAEAWLGDAFRGLESAPADAKALVRRYLGAFGPATVKDAETWSGVASLRDAFEALRPELVTFSDERGKELFDLPDAPRPAADVPAPARFLPEFDSLVLAHDDRSRVVAKEHRGRIFQPGLRILATFLVDGEVAGTWEIESGRKKATLVLSPFGEIAKSAADALMEEGDRLVRFVEPDAAEHAVRIDGAVAPAAARAKKKAPAAAKKAPAPAKKKAPAREKA
jgi:hypothetical protein